MEERLGSWIKHSSKIVHKNNWWQVRKDQVTRPDGKSGEYNFVVSTPAVFIVALDDNQNIYLVGQHRYAINRYSIEVPAGDTEGLDILTSAKRELQEETGLKAKKWQKLGFFYSANAVLAGEAHVYLAQDLEQTNEHEQAEEGIDKLLVLPLKKALEMIGTGEITDGQTISSLMLLTLKQNQQ